MNTPTQQTIPLGTEFLPVCCRQTIVLYKGEITEGTTVHCIWCRSTLVLREGTWEEEQER